MRPCLASAEGERDVNGREPVGFSAAIRVRHRLITNIRTTYAAAGKAWAGSGSRTHSAWPSRCSRLRILCLEQALVGRYR